MAWQAELKQDIGADYGAMRLFAVVEFYDDADRPGTSRTESFPVEIGLGSVAARRQALRTAVEFRGAQIRTITAARDDMRGGIATGAIIPIP